MTTLYVLGSGSGGNAFALDSGGDVLLVDAGFSAREIARRAALVGLDLARATGLVLTHEHGDHTTGAARLAAQLRVPVLASAGTWARLGPKMPRVPFLPLSLMGGVTHGAFHIESCLTSHDAAEPVALSIRSRAGHRVAFAYDLGRPTASVRFLLREAHAIVLEANHDEVMLRTSDYPPVVQDRIGGSTGHLSNRAAAELLADVVHAGLGAVVLAHLSERCNTAELARAAVIAALIGEGGPALHVARQVEPLPPIVLGEVGVGLGR